MRKITVIMVLGLALLLMGLTVSASAVTIADIWAPYQPGDAGVAGASAEQNLYAIVDQMLHTSFYTNSINTETTGLQSTGLGSNPLTLITSGLLPATTAAGTYTYTITSFYVSYASFTQDPGTNAAGSASTTLVGSP
ncbi:MAG: hypothetical protein ACLP2P_08180, partial [Desulfobaccales bacterium]